MIKDKSEHIFFDLDRTLWDFDKNSRTALSQIYENRQLSNYMESFEVFLKKYEKINAALWELYAQHKISKKELRVKRFKDTLEYFNVLSPELAQKIASDYVKTSPFQTHLFPNTIEILGELKNQGKKLHIITNGFLEVQHIKLEKSKLKPYFDVVLCSEEVGVNKPDPKAFLSALEKAKAKTNNSLMVGDDLISDIQGAENIGMKTVLFDPNDKHKTTEHHKIKTLTELKNYL